MDHSQFIEEESVMKKQVSVADYLYLELVKCEPVLASQKRLFELFSAIISAYLNNQTDKYSYVLDTEKIFLALHNRERLGSTALGRGVALPHSRIEGLTNPIISIIRMDSPLDYDTPDNHPIWLVACLLVPIESNNSHLDLLSSLAEKFNDNVFLNCARNARNNKQIYDLFVR